MESHTIKARAGKRRAKEEWLKQEPFTTEEMNLAQMLEFIRSAARENGLMLGSKQLAPSWCKFIRSIIKDKMQFAMSSQGVEIAKIACRMVIMNLKKVFEARFWYKGKLILMEMMEAYMGAIKYYRGL